MPLTWTPVDLAPVLDGRCVTKPPSVLERIDGVRLFYPGRLNLLMGEPESGKTWIAMHAVAQQLAAGKHVVYLDYEDVVDGAVERLKAIGAESDAMLAHLSYIDSPLLIDALAEDTLKALFERRGAPAFVVLDGVTEAMGVLGLDPNKGVDVAGFYRGIPRWFADQGAAVTLLDHVTKDREGRGRWAIGSQHKVSGLDGAAYAVDVVRPFGRQRNGHAKILVSKDRPGHVRQHEGAARCVGVFELDSWPDGKATARLLAPAPMTDPDKPFRPTVLMERVSRVLEAAVAPLSARGVRSLVQGKATMVDTALEILVAEGYVARDDGKRGAALHRSMKPFGTSATEAEGASA